MDNHMIRSGEKLPARSMDEAWQAMNTALDKAGHSIRPVRGRLVVALDLTGSREAGLRRARKATAAMFEAIASLGAIALKLVFFRGEECKSGPWQQKAEDVCRSMLKLSCKAGYTQIGRVLRLVEKEPEPVSAVVFVGDHCEENGEELVSLARALGRKKIPVLLFHEMSDDNDGWKQAKPIFEAIASASGGVYCPFDSSSAEAVRELLSTAAAFTAAGIDGVKKVGGANTPEARQLQAQLLLGPAKGR